MAGRDPFAEALADVTPPADARAGAAGIATTTSVWLPIAAFALVGSLLLAVLPLLGLLPAASAAVLSAIGYALTPGVVMVARVVAQLRMIRAQRAGATLGADVEARLRRLHRLAVASLLVAVPHVWVLAQVAELWLSGR